MASIDQSPDRGAAMPVDAITLQGSTLEFSIAAIRGSYSGTIAADGNSIDGTWTQGQPLPLSLVRATPETAWQDPSPHSARFVTVDTNVKLEVLEWAGPQARNARTLVLVPGLGNTAHIFDALAPKLAARSRLSGSSTVVFIRESVSPYPYIWVRAMRREEEGRRKKSEEGRKE